jgi:hypothetical protein
VIEHVRYMQPHELRALPDFSIMPPTVTGDLVDGKIVLTGTMIWRARIGFRSGETDDEAIDPRDWKVGEYIQPPVDVVARLARERGSIKGIRLEIGWSWVSFDPPPPAIQARPSYDRTTLKGED